MKLCILGDTHLGVRGDSLDFHRYFRRFYEGFFLPFLIEHNITTVFQVGDLMDRRKYSNHNTIFQARQYFFDLLQKNNITLHTIVGNHDSFYKDSLEINSQNLLLGGYSNIISHDKFATVEFDGIPIDVVPWICLENRQRILDSIENSKSQICFGHFELSGFEMDRGIVNFTGEDGDFLSRYDIVLSGHYHHKSTKGNITYVGAPTEMTWVDYKDPKGFHLFDTGTRELEFHKNPFRMFHKIVYDDSIKEQDFQYWKKHDFSSIKECYVKVVVLNKHNLFLFDQVLDSIYKTGPADVNIVEDFSDTNLDLTQEIVDQAEDTLTIINKVIDSTSNALDNNKLKGMVKEIYLEALTRDITD